MEEQVDRLVKQTLERYQNTPASKRYLISVSGIPGSGKSTLAATVTKRLNALHDTQFPGCTTIPVAAFISMDGYHLSRAQLSAMPDPEYAHWRRGAVFTFDGEKFLELVKKLREPLLPETRTLYAPSFDHKIKDPVEDDIAISATARCVLFEGNYLSLNKAPWKDAAALMDELWFVDVGFECATERLVKRHLQAGIARDEEDARKRATETDLLNAKEIVEDRLEVREVVVSREDEEWRPEAQGVGEQGKN